jgi:hypothetical protein
LTDSNRFVAPPQLSLIPFFLNCGKITKNAKFLDPFRARGQKRGLARAQTAATLREKIYEVLTNQTTAWNE